MRYLISFFAIVVAISASPSKAQAQTSDPFFLYYSYFLPRQAALAAQPSVSDSINARAAQQQYSATTNRANLYDPNGGYGTSDPFAPVDPFGATNPRARGGRMGTLGSRGLPTTNINGSGPALYYNRHAQYYPSIRSGRGPNRNLAVAGRGVRGGPGVPSAAAGMALPGPR